MSQIKKIIYFIEAHFSVRDYDRFGVETLIRNGFKVEVWDFTPFLTNKKYQNIQPPDPINWDGLIALKNKKEALSAILKLTQSDFVIPVIHYELKTYSIFRTLSKRKIAFSSSIQSCVLPNSESLKEKIITRLKKTRFKKIPQRIFKMVPFEYLGVKPARIILAPAEKYKIANFPINKRSETLWLHSLDYDNYLKEKVSPATTETANGVFLDQNIPYGVDSIYLDVEPVASPEEYYPLLCKFFDYLENKFSSRIVIAAHPRSHYEKHNAPYNGRTVVHGKTVELVKNSAFVILHHSMSMNYAVLFKKPMIFTTTDKFNRAITNSLVEGPSIEWFASIFGKKAHNLNSKININIDEELVVNETAYNAYKNAYIKKNGSEELPYWQIFANHIKGLI